MSKLKVLITREIPQAGINILQQYHNLEIVYHKGPPMAYEELKSAVKGIDAIIPMVPDLLDKELINSAKILKVIATYSVGYDHIDIEHATKKKVYVANTPGYLTESVAEHAISLMLACSKNIVNGDEFCRKGKFKYWDPMLFIGQKLTGKTLGIIGFGRTGQITAKIAKYGFNMNILYNDIIKQTEAENFLEAKKVDLNYLLENSDIVSLHVNLTDSTKHLIGDEELKKMKPYAILINTVRGPVINEESLVRALKGKWIAGAGLDVYEYEPKIHPELKKLDNVVLTPHIASATWEARIQMARMSAENVIDVLINNKPPRYIVNKSLAEIPAITSLV